jgi:hypothetical protein
LVAVEQAASPGVMTSETVSAAHIKSITFAVIGNGNGAAITTGVQSAYVKVPYGGKLIGWTLMVSPQATGTNTFDIDRVANGSGLPGSGNSIVGAGTPIQITSGNTEASWANFTSWTSTTVTAKDNFTVNVSAADGTIQYANIVLYYE